MFSVTVLLSPLALAQGAQSVQQLLSEAQQAYMRGDLAKAKAQFTTVSQIDPKNPTAIGFLRRIQAEEQKGGASIEKQLAAVVLPRVEFKEATLGSALNYVKQAVANATQNKTNLNFIVQLPPDQVSTQALTLSLRDIPASEVLRYMGNLANVQFEYEKFAVVVKPKGTAQASNAPAPAQ
jgi:hypothetical protein